MDHRVLPSSAGRPPRNHLSRLAVRPWGETKTSEFVKAIPKQESILGTLANLHSRLQLEEFLLVTTLTGSSISQAKKERSPIVFAEGLDRLIRRPTTQACPKARAVPTLGISFALFLRNLEAQEIWEKFNGQTCALNSGTTAYKDAQGKRLP
jgi:hypothetical protein